MHVQHPRRPAAAFTLVELLVVIGVIAILIGILLPAVRGARRQAHLAQCASNLRTLVQACQMHAQTKRGFYPLAGQIHADPVPVNASGDFPSGLNDPLRRRYSYSNIGARGTFLTPIPLPAALAEYLGVTGLPMDDWRALDQALNAQEGVWRRFTCPDTNAPEKAKYNSDPNDSSRVDQGTMMSTAIGSASADSAWSTNSDYGLNEGVFGFHYDRRYARNRLGGNTAAIRRPSETALFTDAVARKAPAYSFMPLGWITWTPSLAGTGPATLGDAFAGNGRVESRDMFDTNRHNQRINVAFADGHVETVPLTQPEMDRIYIVPP